MIDTAIHFQNVEKKFGRKKVLRSLNMNVPAGSVYALLGCNGVGKSTSVKMMVGQLEPNAGEIRIMGRDPVRDAVALRRETGYVAENQRLFNELTLEEYCSFLKKFYPDWNDELCSSILRRFKLPADGKLGSFSRGMYSKAALVVALCRKPKLLILDDPTLGLDTAARHEFMDMILETLPEFEHTVLISSHIINELEGLCDHAGIVRDGKMVIEGDLDSLKSGTFRLVIRKLEKEPPPLPGEVKRTPKLDTLEIVCGGPREPSEKALSENGITDIEFHSLSLEEIFLAYSE